jgi:GTP-binding protein of the ras superfamily involved in termination of M-phase
MKESSGMKRLEKNDDDTENHIQVKVGMIGESQAGKTSLMVKYIEGKFDEDYIETLGVNFMEKTIKLRKLTVTLSV